MVQVWQVRCRYRGYGAGTAHTVQVQWYGTGTVATVEGWQVQCRYRGYGAGMASTVQVQWVRRRYGGHGTGTVGAASVRCRDSGYTR